MAAIVCPRGGDIGKFFPPSLTAEPATIATAGDSKSNSTYDWWTGMMSDLSTDTLLTWTRPFNSSYGGGGVVQLFDGLTASPPNPATPAKWVFLNIGVNNVTDTSIITQALFEEKYGGILDIFHAQWPSAQIYCMRIWKDDTLDGGHPLWAEQIANIDDVYIPNVLSSRSWAHLGPDERVWLPGKTDDGIHPNAAGLLEAKAQWRAMTPY